MRNLMQINYITICVGVSLIVLVPLDKLLTCTGTDSEKKKMTKFSLLFVITTY